MLKFRTQDYENARNIAIAFFFPLFVVGSYVVRKLFAVLLLL